jgi:hypothetical protein
MTDTEIHMMSDMETSLRTIAVELKKANKLKAIQMRREFKDDADEIDDIMEES